MAVNVSWALALDSDVCIEHDSPMRHNVRKRGASSGGCSQTKAGSIWPSPHANSRHNNEEFSLAREARGVSLPKQAGDGNMNIAEER